MAFMNVKWTFAVYEGINERILPDNDWKGMAVQSVKGLLWIMSRDSGGIWNVIGLISWPHSDPAEPSNSGRRSHWDANGNEPFRICERERICFHALWVVQLAVCYFDWSTAVYIEGSGGSVYEKWVGSENSVFGKKMSCLSSPSLLTVFWAQTLETNSKKTEPQFWAQPTQ